MAQKAIETTIEIGNQSGHSGGTKRCQPERLHYDHRDPDDYHPYHAQGPGGICNIEDDALPAEQPRRASKKPNMNASMRPTSWISSTARPQLLVPAARILRIPVLLQTQP
jgi:hypothetical protein